MSQAIRAYFEPLRSIAFGSIGASYTAIGNPFANPIRILFIDNTTNATLTFSFDGVSDHLVILANTPRSFDFSANKTNPEGFMIAQGTTVYVKQNGTPSSGSVYVAAIYGKQ